ncbi:RNA ligase/cyclic nucleotide phosphodiesterase [Dipodascopsis uninucleata]
MFIESYPTPALLAEAYERHRRTRNADKRKVLLISRTVTPDPILKGLVLDNKPPEFDPRNCVTLWCRPTHQVIQLIQNVQDMLLSVEPELWVMPPGNLHLTALEILHSADEEHMANYVTSLKPVLKKLLAPHPAPVLVRPILSFDQSALALSFLPVSSYRADGEWYSYHHYRKDLYDIVQSHVPVDSRYQVPSAHVTIARFVKGLSIPVEKWVAKLDEINTWLDNEGGRDIKWTIGDERGAECRCGRIWYGGGISEETGLSLQEASHSDSFDMISRKYN